MFQNKVKLYTLHHASYTIGMKQSASEHHSSSVTQNVMTVCKLGSESIAATAHPDVSARELSFWIIGSTAGGQPETEQRPPGHAVRDLCESKGWHQVAERGRCCSN
jgi:hypothetical protein